MHFSPHAELLVLHSLRDRYPRETRAQHFAFRVGTGLVSRWCAGQELSGHEGLLLQVRLEFIEPKSPHEHRITGRPRNLGKHG